MALGEKIQVLFFFPPCQAIFPAHIASGSVQGPHLTLPGTLANTTNATDETRNFLGKKRQFSVSNASSGWGVSHCFPQPACAIAQEAEVTGTGLLT